MKLTPVTDISRFLSIDGTTIVRIFRWKTDFSYSHPPVMENQKVVWGTSDLEMNDRYFEIGQLQDVLKTIAPQEMVAAAAMANPKQFAEMVAAAHDLNDVFYIASRAMLFESYSQNPIPNAIRFCSIDVSQESINFYERVPDLDKEQHETPGVYCVSFSLTDFVVKSRILVEEYPKQS